MLGEQIGPSGPGGSNGNSFNMILDPLGLKAKSEPYLVSGRLLLGSSF